MNETDLKTAIKSKYGKAAIGATDGGGCCGGGCGDPITSNLYDAAERAALPAEAVSASLGCGNPTAMIDLQPGETVLDLGSGGGIDVLLSARRVGPTGKAYGLDMTDEMLALARANQRRAGVDNVEFLKGEIEAIPLPDQSVDVVISNCVINLSSDKDRVLREAFRVLKPGGRFAVSDVVVRGAVPAEVRRSVELWVGCVAGALDESEYREKLARAGFQGVEIEPWRVYAMKDARDFLAAAGLDPNGVEAAADGKFASAFIRAIRPSSSLGQGVRVLFLCSHNSARSQMAEALLRHLTPGVEVASAGTEVTRVHPLAIKAMARQGFDISQQQAKNLSELAGKTFDYIITVCDRARESCPIISGAPQQIHWSIPDPSAVEGDEATQLQAFQGAAIELLARIRLFVALLERRKKP
jgi:arsenite methyltransferase